MYLCSWTVEGVQCSNRTRELVCTECEPAKRKLYRRYKEAEKTVISALSQPPRGDLLEVSKVMGRITRVVELRRNFTSRLAPQVRDPGHEYHVSQLLQVLSNYRDYLCTLTEESTTIDDTDEPDTTESISNYTQSITEQVKQVAEEDPFAAFDETIQAYRKKEAHRAQLLEKLSVKLALKGEELDAVVGFYIEVLRSLRTISKHIRTLLHGYVVAYNFRRVICQRVTIQALEFLLKECNLGVGTFKDWILEYARKPIRHIFTLYEKSVIFLILCGNDPFPLIHRVEFRVNAKGNYSATIIPIDPEVMSPRDVYERAVVGMTSIKQRKV